MSSRRYALPSNSFIFDNGHRECWPTFDSPDTFHPFNVAIWHLRQCLPLMFAKV